MIDANVGPDRPLPANAHIELSFDRFLNPRTVVRQSFVVRAAGGAVDPPFVTYDPVRRVVGLWNPHPDGPEWLKAGQSYSVELVPANPTDINSGLRAIDGATLDLASQRRIGFLASEPDTKLKTDPVIDFCDDVFPLFQNHCSSAGCHGAPERREPASSLILGTSLGVSRTALGRVAQGTNTGPRAGIPRAPDELFGINMPIIDPQNPGNSFLLYKLFLATPPQKSDPSIRPRCDGTQGPSPAAALPRKIDVSAYRADFSAVSSDERARLSDLVFGAEMPYPSNPGAPPGASSANPPLTFDELERVRLWITQGANVLECGSCQP